MTADECLARLRHGLPVHVHLKDGGYRTVRDARCVLLTPGALVLGFPAEGQEWPLVDRYEGYALEDVVSIQPANPQAPDLPTVAEAAEGGGP